MSDDLVDRLLGYPDIDECVEAADEIIGIKSANARLRAELAAERERFAQLIANADARNNQKMASIATLCNEANRLRAELAAERERAEDKIAKLREALVLARNILSVTDVNERIAAFAAIDAVLAETGGGDE
jgi:seryl-tRNA synthetase